MHPRIKKSLIVLAIYEAVVTSILIFLHLEKKRQERQIQAFNDANSKWPVGEQYRADHAAMLAKHGENLADFDRRKDRLFHK